MLKKLITIFLSMLITLSFLLPYLALKQEKLETEVQKNKYIASQRINDISQQLVEVLNQSFEYVQVLELIIKINPNDSELIKTYAEMILQKHGTIQNIAIAPNGIVKFIYPTEQNQRAIGHNLMLDPLRYPFIQKAINEKRTTIQGPVEAVQGGILIFNRKPLFITKDNVEKFWGLCVVSVDFEKVMDYCGISTDDPDYYFAIKAQKSDGFQDFVWGNTECYTNDSITHTINFENQKWELAIYPKEGWKAIGEKLYVLDATDQLYLFLSFILFMFILWHLNKYYESYTRSKIDIMTGALNKSTFKKSVIKNLKKYKKNKVQAIIVIDINDFKSINDTYGHLVGDGVIIELSKRFMEIIRGNNLLARWGGDEFVIYLCNLSSLTDMNTIIKRIYHEVEAPIDVSGVSINARVALGYALYPMDGVNFEELYKKADKMMYSNKPTQKREEVS
ncbi:hypothetical protein CS063_04890 [Sporanaerobium hydrogeniformans]|uniref:Uncharacterized protein n=1 Tax=Sporanaerobium hydrogeniformans TaxID=3072179 RepID=A0AC61DDP3_9FIRM|nr:diguanylate cyclase [Sporanaerobium hydrogeniformans]PHV71389.1 hypothetical protein CS063_04890 [Sporanaerobium hydrogeniformans]